MKAPIAAIAMLLVSSPAWSWEQTLCYGGSGTTFKLKCAYAVLKDDFLVMRGANSTCSLFASAEPYADNIWQYTLPFATLPGNVTWTLNIPIGCRAGLFPWHTWMQVTMNPRRTSGGVYYTPPPWRQHKEAETLRSGKGAGCPPIA